MVYVIVRCQPLNDQYECDADRIPIYITNEYSKKYKRWGYEVYQAIPLGKNPNEYSLKLIQSYEDYDERGKKL